MRVRSRVVLLLCAASLLHFTLGKQSVLSFELDANTVNGVTLECLLSSFMEPATFILRDQSGTVIEQEETTEDQKTLTIDIRPHNESIVSCIANGGSESDRVAIIGMCMSKLCLTAALCFSLTLQLYRSTPAQKLSNNMSILTVLQQNLSVLWVLGDCMKRSRHSIALAG